MVMLTPAERINRAGVMIGEAVSPFVAANAPSEGELDSWLPVLAAKDETDGRPPLQRSMSDVRVLLLVQARYWRNFRYPTKPSQTAWANELLGTLNRVAHVPHQITFVDLITFLGIAHKLLGSLNVDPELQKNLQHQAHEAMRDSLQHDGVLPTPEAPLPPAGPGESLTPLTVSPAPAAPAPPVQSAPQPPVPSSVEATEDTADPAPEPHESNSAAAESGRKNELSREEATNEEARLIELFFPRIPGSDVGLDDEFIAVRNLRMVVFYRKDLNFALAHNRVSVFAGIGVVAGGPESDGSADENTVHKISGLSARLGSLRNDDSAAWTGPKIELHDGERWWAEPADLNWALPHGHFIGIDEATADTLELEFEYDGVRIQRSIPLRVLAHDQWTPATVPEIVAAFVRPRAEAVASVLSTTSDLLAERTNDPSLVGYQDTPERVLETVKAIYDAIRSFDIRYSEPPASFESDGQKIRTSDVVLHERFGTCVDTTVLFAAVLEEAGIQPYIVLLKGHALVGFTLKPVTTEPVTSDSDQLSKPVRQWLLPSDRDHGVRRRQGCELRGRGEECARYVQERPSSAARRQYPSSPPPDQPPAHRRRQGRGADHRRRREPGRRQSRPATCLGSRGGWDDGAADGIHLPVQSAAVAVGPARSVVPQSPPATCRRPRCQLPRTR
ncbi:hypothetical protein [Brevibacterium pityocampae]